MACPLLREDISQTKGQFSSFPEQYSSISLPEMTQDSEKIQGKSSSKMRDGIHEFTLLCFYINRSHGGQWLLTE